MNPGTFYLYEYENKKRRRNVGFIKISKHYQSCIIQIRIIGIPAGNGTSLPLYAFFRTENYMIGKQIASLSVFSGNISARFSVSETHFPQNKPLSGIDGFLIRRPGQNSSLFWMASEYFFDADPALMKTEEEAPSPQNFSPEEPPAPAENETGTVPDSDSESEPESEPESESESKPESEPESEPDSVAKDPASKVISMTSSENHDTTCQVRKISHSEISRLPSRLWPLANNSFLLHGYRNYGHLLIIKENGRFWLGVPGIFDSQEARVAELYGFPRFTRSYVTPANLTEDERNDKADFGHWCRCTGPCSQDITG